MIRATVQVIRTVGVVSLVLAVACCAGPQGRPSGPATATPASASKVSFADIPAATLAAHGITLTSATGPVTTTQDQAVMNVNAQIPKGSRIRQLLLAHFSDSSAGVTCDCWVVESQTGTSWTGGSEPNGFSGTPPVYTWRLSVVDARTGAWLLNVEG